MNFHDCKRRAALLELAFDRFRPQLIASTAKRSNMDPLDLQGVHVNPAILYAVAASYFFDIHRAKSFHDTTLANECRQAAFTVKWLVRFRPVLDVNPHGRFLFVNEKFALAVAFALLRIDPDTVDADLYAHLLYSLRYRHLDEGALIAVFLALRQRAA